MTTFQNINPMKTNYSKIGENTNKLFNLSKQYNKENDLEKLRQIEIKKSKEGISLKKFDDK